MNGKLVRHMLSVFADNANDLKGSIPVPITVLSSVLEVTLVVTTLSEIPLHLKLIIYLYLQITSSIKGVSMFRKQCLNEISGNKMVCL